MALKSAEAPATEWQDKPHARQTTQCCGHYCLRVNMIEGTIAAIGILVLSLVDAWAYAYSVLIASNYYKV